MHKYLTKIIILTSTLVILYAGLAPRAMHAGAILSATGAAAAVKGITENTATVNNALSGRTSSSLSYMPEWILSTSQPLGELVIISWDDLYALSFYPAYTQLLSLYHLNDISSQLVGAEKETHTSTVSSAMNSSVPNEINVIAEIYPNDGNQATIGISCAACHGTMHAFDANYLLGGKSPTVPHQVSSAPKLECDQCHLQQTTQSYWQSRGVE